MRVEAPIFATADLLVAKPELADALAEAIGRMVLTNDLIQSLICTILFCGWRFELIGRLDRTARTR